MRNLLAAIAIFAFAVASGTGFGHVMAMDAASHGMIMPDSACGVVACPASPDDCFRHCIFNGGASGNPVVMVPATASLLGIALVLLIASILPLRSAALAAVPIREGPKRLLTVIKRE